MKSSATTTSHWLARLCRSRQQLTGSFTLRNELRLRAALRAAKVLNVRFWHGADSQSGYPMEETLPMIQTIRF